MCGGFQPEINKEGIHLKLKVLMKKGIKTVIRVAALLIFALMAFSCIHTRTIMIEIPETAAKNLPESIQSLVIVNRTVDGKYRSHDADSLQSLLYGRLRLDLLHGNRLDTEIYDIQAADTMLEVIGELLFESGRYDYVIPENRFVEFNQSPASNYEMPWSEVKELCLRFNTNAVLSIDRYMARITGSLSDQDVYNAFTGFTFGTVMSQLQVSYDVLIRVYDPVNETIVLNEIQSNSLFWDDINNVTTVKQALAESSIAIALDLAGKIATNWNPEQRNLFTKNSYEFDRPVNLAAGGNWAEAIEMWERILESPKSKTQQSKVEFNIAVGYEMLGDIDQAISWALKSYNTMYHPLTYKYLENLQQRKTKLETSAK